MYSERNVLHFISVAAIQTLLDVSQSCQVGSWEASKVEKMHLLHPLTRSRRALLCCACLIYDVLPSHPLLERATVYFKFGRVRQVNSTGGAIGMHILISAPAFR